MVSIFDSTFDDLFNNFFYSYPKETKPPTEILRTTDSSGKPTGIQLQVLLAGFTEQDVKVFLENKVLHIKGDNKKVPDIAERFKLNFDFSYRLHDSLNAEKSKVTFKDGILFIDIPLQEEEKSYKMLFSK